MDVVVVDDDDDADAPMAMPQAVPPMAAEAISIFPRLLSSACASAVMMRGGVKRRRKIKKDCDFFVGRAG